MEKAVATIEAEALKLSPIARLELVDAILGSLDVADEKMDRLWSEEAEDRLSAYRRGELKAISLEEVLAKYRTS
ncbi:MAG: addiction module protein [Magnetococcales bacterium]|nr:addiction module protein [Magnetococcales bacterium]